MKNYLAIDIGGTNIKYGLVSDQGMISNKGKVSSESNNLDEFLAKLYPICEQFKGQYNKIAISVPGKVDIKAQKIYFGGSLPFIHNVSMQSILGNRYSVPVYVENDGKCAVLGEQWMGSLQNEKSCAAIVLGTGIGGGIIVNGQLLHGAHFQAGEFSFILSNPLKKKFDYIFGQQFSAVKMISDINCKLNNPVKNDGKAAFEAIKSGNSVANQIFEQYCSGIAALILNIQVIVDLNKIAVGGGISAQPAVVKEINRQYDLLLKNVTPLDDILTRPQIVNAELKNDANLYGAVYAAKRV